MRSHDVQSEMAAGYEPSTPPMIGPDGTPHRVARPAPTDPPPRLCEQGPCRHYHYFAVHMDSQTATGAAVDDRGQIVGEAGEEPARLERHHYCYPTVGVEFVLGDFPVTECSLWTPRDWAASSTDDVERAKWMASPAGVAYETAVDRWRRRQAELRVAEQSAIDEVARELAQAEAERDAQPTTTEPESTP